ncbi:MAG: terpene cyclase/mutase family protein, partial [Planctomycetota bacterium]|nr:terpene cyclase/mutase family protein [Planctomycetota bacterium]
MKGSGVVWSAFLVPILLLNSGCGDPSPPVAETPAEPSPKTPPRPPAAPRPLELAEIEPIALDPGAEASVGLKLERNGNEGVIDVIVEGAAEGIAVAADPIAADKSEGQLLLTAAASLGEEALDAPLQVIAKIGDLKAERTLRVSVPKVNLPSVQPVAEVVLQPGTAARVGLKLDRRGFTGPLNLVAEDVPAKVTCKVAPVGDTADETELEIAVDAGAPDGEHKILAAATLFGRQVAAEVPLKIESRPYRVESFRVVTIAPGESQRVEMPIERRSYKGAIDLAATGLPAGVQIKRARVADDQATAVLEIAADAGAAQRVASSQVVSKAGNLSGADPIVIRISEGDDMYLPPGVTGNPEIAPLLRRGSIGGRLTAESKQALLDFYGGTPESEAAVMRGLKWLAAHQQPDGSWSLKDYPRGIEGCDCKIPFEENLDDNDPAGTAFGILPFLGAGVTHNRAPASPPELATYKEVVEKGLVFLAKNQTRSTDKKDGRFHENMYAHALGTIAFCEAFGLSGDKRLQINAQLAIKYLLAAQHDQGGGWRYRSGQEGDMSVTGWVFLAIRSAQLAGLMVDRAPLVRAERFVNSCAAGPEAAKMSRYAYLPGQEPRLSLSAAGLLTRQYLGWRKDEPDLVVGASYLMENLPPEKGGSLGAIY